MKRFVIRGVLALAVLAGLAYAAVSAYAGYTLSVPIRQSVSFDPKSFAGLDFEAVRFPARDGRADISAWYMPAKNSVRAIIMAHGKDSCKGCEFGKRSLELARSYQQAGFNVLMIDLRGHGASSDARFTFGLRERHDVLGAYDWLRTHGNTTIGAFGVSMGAATVIGAAKLEPGIKAVLADSGYADFHVLLYEQFASVAKLPSFLVPGTALAVLALTGEDVRNNYPMQDVVGYKSRLMLVHAQGDALINVWHAEALARTSESMLWVMPGKFHTDTYTNDSQVYTARAIAFFNQNLRVP